MYATEITATSLFIHIDECQLRQHPGNQLKQLDVFILLNENLIWQNKCYLCKSL